MSRKQEFSNLSQEQLDIFLEAESLGILEEVPGGWLLNGRFTERLHKDSIAMACLEHDIFCCKQKMGEAEELW
jgi:hypothetical protein